LTYFGLLEATCCEVAALGDSAVASSYEECWNPEPIEVQTHFIEVDNMDVSFFLREAGSV
jgi:hypothetical protein